MLRLAAFLFGILLRVSDEFLRAIHTLFTFSITLSGVLKEEDHARYAC